MKSFHCYTCHGLVAEEDAVWVDPVSKEAKGPPDGMPFHVGCAPSQASSWTERVKNPKVITFCDFGDEGRKTELARHKTFATAMRQYARLWQVYHRISGWKVWQEEVKGV